MDININTLNDAHGENVSGMRLRERVSQLEWAGEIARCLETAFLRDTQAYPDLPPLGTTSWGHYFFCSRCGSRLTLDFKSPHLHHCHKCHATYEGEKYDGAWLKGIHTVILDNLERAAILALIHPSRPEFRDWIRQTLLFYAEHYGKDYPPHGEKVGKGKITAQSLDEAVFMITYARVVNWGEQAEWFSADELTYIDDNLFRPAISLIKPQITRIHNTDAWMLAMLATLARRLNDTSLTDFVLNGEFGWTRQLEEGVLDDGFWFEGSIGYHFYAYTALFTGAQALGSSNDQALVHHPRLNSMLQAPLEIALPDGTFPAYNDCPFGYPLIDEAPLYERATGLGIRDYSNALSWMYDTGEARSCITSNRASSNTKVPAGRYNRCSILALLYGPPELPPSPTLPRSSKLFPQSGIGILRRDDMQIAMRFAPGAEMHDHHDKLSVDIYLGRGPQSLDPGVCGYGADVTMNWYRTDPAHNLVVVDEGQQSLCDGKLLCWAPEKGVVSASADDAYPDVRMRREIKLLQDGWEDTYYLESSNEHTYDWFFHADAHINDCLDWQVGSPFGTGPGYSYISDAVSTQVDHAWSMRWISPAGGSTLEMTFEGVSNTDIVKGICPGHPDLNTWSIIAVRRKCRNTVFKTRFRILKG